MAKHDKLLTTRDVAALAGVTTIYVYQLVKRGLLPPPVIDHRGRRGSRKPSAWRASEIRPALAKFKKMPWGSKSMRAAIRAGLVPAQEASHAAATR